MENLKWPSLLTPALPIKKIAELSPPLTTKGVPKWVTDELSLRQCSSIDDDRSEGSNSDLESMSSNHSDSIKKNSIANFIHFSPLTCTYVCIPKKLKISDPSLQKLGPEVLKLIRNIITPNLLCGRVRRESGDDSLVVQFHVPDEALAPGGHLEYIEDICLREKIIFVKRRAKLTVSNSSAVQINVPFGNSELGSTTKSAEDVDARLQDVASSVPEKKNITEVSFTIPCRYCVPMIQGILEEAQIMKIVGEHLQSGRVLSAINVITAHINENKVGFKNAYGRIEAAVLYSFRSHLYFNCGSFKNAISDAVKSMKLDPSQVEGYAVAVKSYIALGYPEIAGTVAAEARSSVTYLTSRFIRGSLLSNMVMAFQKWRSSGNTKIRLEVLPLPAAVRFAAYRYNKTHTHEEVSVNLSSAQERNAVLESYFTHPLKHPNYPGFGNHLNTDLEVAGIDGFPDSSHATAAWINCVYSSSLNLLKHELLEFCTPTMFFTCRSNRVHATYTFSPNNTIFEEKVALLLPLVGNGPTRIRLNGKTVVNVGDNVLCCQYCGRTIQTENTKSLPLNYTTCTLGCGTAYCSSRCRDHAASEYHWVECCRSILLNIGAYGVRNNWASASFGIRRSFLVLDSFIANLVPELRLTKKVSGEKGNENPDQLYAIAISLRLFKQIVAIILSFTLVPLLGVHPITPLIEEQIQIQRAKLDQLLQDLETVKIRPGKLDEKSKLIVAEKVLHALRIPFVVDANYAATPTVAEDLKLCPSLSLIPQISKRDLKFGSAETEIISQIPPDIKSSITQQIWIFIQSVAHSIQEYLSDEPLPNQKFQDTTTESRETPSAGFWTCSSLLSFLGAPRFIPQLWDFCCSAYCIAEVPFPMASTSQEFTLPVAVVSPFTSVITDLTEFTGNCAYSRFCFEHEIQSRTMRSSREDDSIMSVCSMNDSELSINSQPQAVPDACDPSPWIQWCSAMAAGCTNLDTPVVSVTEASEESGLERRVTVTSSGPVKLDDMIRLQSAWCCT